MVISAEELLERILILTTVNSTLIHALLSLEAKDDVGPKQIEQLADGVRSVRDSVKQTLASSAKGESVKGSSFVDDTIQVILTHLGRIEKALDRLAKTREAEAVSVDATEVKAPIKAAQRLIAEATIDLTGLTGKPFQRRLSVHDPENMLPPIQGLLDKYSSRSHLLLPNFWFEAYQELLRYSEPREVISNVARIAGKVFHSLMRRFLAEAPCAGLLQELLRRGSSGMELTHSEKSRIISDAREFYNRLATALSSGSVSKSVGDIKRTMSSFDWGPADAEKRVIGIFYRSAQELVDRAANGKTISKQERIICAELAQYICVLSASLFTLPRFRKVLADMKV
ncbi:MAG: hypothetical protein ACFFDP_08765 [Promethearchaeota archaeon]